MIEVFVLTEVCKLLGANLPQLNLEASFVQNGGDSLAAAALTAVCKTQGCELARETILTSCTFWEILYSVRKPKEVNTSPFHFGFEQCSSTYITKTFKSNGPAKTPGRRPSLSRHKSFNHVRSPARAESLSTGIDHPSNNDRQKPTPPLSHSSCLANFEEDLLTEMQLSLIHGSLKTPGMNVIKHSETFYSEDIPIVKAAWKTVIEAEPIFHALPLHRTFGQKTIAFDWRETLIEKDSNESIVPGLDGERCIESFFQVVPCKSTPGRWDRSTIIWTVHHALIDGYSASLVFDKVRTVANGTDVQRGPSFWQLARDLRQFQQLHRERGNAYWLAKREIGGSSKGELLLPLPDEKIDQTLGLDGSDVIIDITSIQDKLHSIARDINVTPAAFFNSAWALVLATYVDSDAVVFGAVLSGRGIPLPNAMSTVGPLVNTLPLSVKIERNISVKDFIRSVFQNLVELEGFEWTTPANGFSRQFESALAVQHQRPNPSNFENRGDTFVHPS